MGCDHVLRNKIPHTVVISSPILYRVQYIYLSRRGKEPPTPALPVHSIPHSPARQSGYNYPNTAHPNFQLWNRPRSQENKDAAYSQLEKTDTTNHILLLLKESIYLVLYPSLYRELQLSPSWIPCTAIFPNFYTLVWVFVCDSSSVQLTRRGSPGPNRVLWHSKLNYPGYHTEVIDSKKSS